jgi:hypothetical protein
MVSVAWLALVASNLAFLTTSVVAYAHPRYSLVVETVWTNLCFVVSTLYHGYDDPIGSAPEWMRNADIGVTYLLFSVVAAHALISPEYVRSKALGLACVQTVLLILVFQTQLELAVFVVGVSPLVVAAVWAWTSRHMHVPPFPRPRIAWSAAGMVSVSMAVYLLAVVLPDYYAVLHPLWHIGVGVSLGLYFWACVPEERDQALAHLQELGAISTA